MIRKLQLLLVLFAALPCAVAPLRGQSYTTIPPSQCVWHPGDDPAWAAADLDESTWRPTSQWTGIATPTPNFWLRCRFDPSQLASGVQSALQVSGDLAWRVYVDGRPIGQSGDLATGAHMTGMAVDYDTSGLLRRNQPLSVAVRMTFTPRMFGLRALPQLALGDADSQRAAYMSSVYMGVKAQWVTWACYGLITSAGLFFLALYWFDRTQRYVLWISLTWLSLADLRINEFLDSASVHYPARLEFFLYAIGQNLVAFAMLFTFAVNQRRMPSIFRILLSIDLLYALALTVAAFLPLHWSMPLQWWVDINPWVFSIFVLAMSGSSLSRISAFWPLRSLQRGLLPIAIVCSLWMVMDLIYLLVQLPFLNLDINSTLLKIQPYRSIAVAMVVISLTLLLIQRIRSTNRERAALAGEMRAARAVQQVIIPEAIPTVSGFAIKAVYNPAGEVGGDFFQILLTSAGGVLIAIGDVSGKGMPAAMTVSLLVGTLRTLAHYTQSPGEILAAMNQRMLARSHGGFTTCLVVRADPGGQLIAANAGHLAPYVNGEEVKIENGLPLGLAADANYTESTFTMTLGGTLTLLSDGVVEARNPQGELFGFERTAKLSTQSAEAIASAAQAFGQDDDITVLTLSYANVQASA